MQGERYIRPPAPSWNTEAAGSCCAWPGHTGRGDAVRHVDKTPRSRSKKRTFPKFSHSLTGIMKESEENSR